MKKLAIASMFAAALGAGPALAAGDADILRCREVEDSLARLNCYDRIAVEVPRASSSAASKAVTFVSAELRHQGEDYKRDIFSPRIEMHPVFKNGSGKTVTGIALRMTVRDAFGDVLIEGNDNLDIRLDPGKTGSAGTFYLWEDNPFIRTQPYDKMIGPVTAGTAKVEIDILKVVYSDGTVETY